MKRLTFLAMILSLVAYIAPGAVRADEVSDARARAEVEAQAARDAERAARQAAEQAARDAVEARDRATQQEAEARAQIEALRKEAAAVAQQADALRRQNAELIGEKSDPKSALRKAMAPDQQAVFRRMQEAIAKDHAARTERLQRMRDEAEQMKAKGASDEELAPIRERIARTDAEIQQVFGKWKQQMAAAMGDQSEMADVGKDARKRVKEAIAQEGAKRSEQLQRLREEAERMMQAGASAPEIDQARARIAAAEQEIQQWKIQQSERMNAIARKLAENRPEPMRKLDEIGQRIKHFRAASENLRAAGEEEMARQLNEKAEAMQQEARRAKEAMAAEIAKAREVKPFDHANREIQELRQQVEQMRAEMQQLREQIRKQ